MKIIAAIDSFKGSMTSEEANQAVIDALPQHEVYSFPIADGGEGTVEAFVSVEKGEIRSQTITGVNGEPYQGKWGWIEKDKTAIIEVAEGAGIIQANEETFHPENHTSFGVGEQIRQALDHGAETIILGLGGSATTDGGMGLLQALGAVFKGRKGNVLLILPVDLSAVSSIETTSLDSRLKEVNWQLASDVANPLLGESGAVYVFGEQKGLSKDELSSYDEAMTRFANLVSQTTQTDERETQGAGAAGGIGFAALSFFNCTFQSGLTLLAERGMFKDLLTDADLVITGEGKFDTQSLQGKVPIGISRLCKEAGIPVLLFAGKIEEGLTEVTEENIQAVIPIVDAPMPLKEAMMRGPELLGRAVTRAFRLIDLDRT
ncbi:glycerate kinase [Alkalibacterium olivapovliticus]|uniref:Glycerate kinase n=1 Tax=Alkalibacterium olivapovliticus TaxID=99907 RepID=A0A2T0VU98_9LACT|nr:glycerate kinase [Alkalibacterium olivapovliticus]PRY74861.1 glycerate kinase [Alkalibacterium olivapovliticus]